MPEVIFNKLVLKGFGCFVETTSLPLDHNGLHFVRGQNRANPRLGANGVGKSSLFGGLCWILYGRTYDNRRGPDISSWFGKGPVHGRLHLTVDGQEYVISRTTRPNRLTINEEATTEEAVVKLIGLELPVFLTTVLLGQGKPWFLDLDPSKKMELISDVLQLERWEEKSAHAKKITEFYTEEAHNARNKLQVEQALAQETKDALIACQKRKNDWGAKQAALLEHCREELAGEQKKLEKIETERAEYALTYDSAGTERLALEKELDAKTSERTKAEAAMAKIGAKIEIQKRYKTSLTIDMENLLEDPKTCPTCGQKVTPKHLAKHKAELREQLKKVQAELDGLSIVDATKAYNLAWSRCKVAKDAYDVFREKENKARDKLDYFNPLVAECKALIKNLRQQIEEIEGGTNPFLKEWQALKDKQSKSRREQEELEATVAEKERKIERYQYWIKGFKEVRLLIIEETLEELELVANSMLEMMGLTDWQIQFNTERETKSGTIQSKIDTLILSPYNRDAVRWECWSGGEGQRLKIIATLALSEVLLNQAGVRVNLEIFDEPSTFVSGTGGTDLIDMLSERATDLDHTILFVDHTIGESAKFASTIVVERTEKGSELHIE